MGQKNTKGPTGPFVFLDFGIFQVLNDDPQPQVVFAFGFLITNWAP